MRSEVIIRLADQQEFRVDLSALAPLESDAGRRWLDEQFQALDCEPLRASGKVLLADKVLTVARAAGARLLGDASWVQDFARAASAALAKPVVVVDVAAMAVSF